MKRLLLIIFLALPFATRADEFSGLMASVERQNLSLKQMREEMKAAGYEIKEQNLPDNTSLEYSPFFRRGAEGIASSELIVTQEFDFPSLYIARNKAGKSKMAMAERQYLVEARNVMIEAALNYINLVKLNKVNHLLKARLDNAQKLSESTTKKFEAGEVTSVEMNTVRMMNVTLGQQILANDADIASVKSALKELNGYEPIVCEAESYPDWTFSEGLSHETESDAEYQLAKSEVENGRMEEKVARQGWVPKLTLGYRRNTELEEASNGFVVGASFPLFSNSAKVKAAKARKAAAEIGMENIRLKVASEIESLKEELSLISKSMSIYDKNLVEDTERLLWKSVDAGRITILEYYNELNLLNERRMEYIDVEYEYYKKLCVLYKNYLR